MTAKVYTDDSQLPVYDAVKGLPYLFDHTQIRAQIFDAGAPHASQSVANNGEIESTEPIENEMDSRVETLRVASGRMERVKGIEPSCPAWEAGVLPLNYTRGEVEG